MENIEKNTVGVVIGKFESPVLHTGHRYLITTAHNENQTLCVVLGTNGGVPTNIYPMDIETRKLLILDKFPDAIILQIRDLDDTTLWSNALDKMLIGHFAKTHTWSDIILYGSKDSFLQNYNGMLKTKYIREVADISATPWQLTQCIQPLNSADFRIGCIYSTLTRFAIMFSCVDIIVYRIRWTGIEVLMGERYVENGRYRYPGGIVDPTDLTHQYAALRELMEETGSFYFGTLEYLCSMKINTPYYRGSRDALMTTAFITPYLAGTPVAGDDLDEVHWVPLKDVLMVCVKSHVGLSKEVIKYFKYRNNFLVRTWMKLRNEIKFWRL